LLGAEPFVYGGSGSSNKQVKRNKTAIYKLRQETARLREEIEGLRSIIEGLNQSVGRLQQQKGSGTGDKKLLTDIANLIDKINQNYVSKAELNRALESGQVKKANKPSVTKTAVKETKKKPTPSQKNNLAKASSSALYSKGVRLVGKKRYTDAKKRFDILASRGYKKASTHFYLGEISYRTSHYSDAVEEYKQSAELNENAGYMDKLLLHTGIALEKSGDRDQAKRFFQAIVDGYPGTASAKVAKKHL
jgi:TolA-binding protein